MCVCVGGGWLVVNELVRTEISPVLIPYITFAQKVLEGVAADWKRKENGLKIFKKNSKATFHFFAF